MDGLRLRLRFVGADYVIDSVGYGGPVHGGDGGGDGGGGGANSVDYETVDGGEVGV